MAPTIQSQAPETSTAKFELDPQSSSDLTKQTVAIRILDQARPSASTSSKPSSASTPETKQETRQNKSQLKSLPKETKSDKIKVKKLEESQVTKTKVEKEEPKTKNFVERKGKYRCKYANDGKGKCIGHEHYEGPTYEFDPAPF